jgi:hypothetical protein
MTATWVEERIGVPGFLEDLRAALKAGTFGPLPVRERAIPKPGWWVSSAMDDQLAVVEDAVQGFPPRFQGIATQQSPPAAPRRCYRARRLRAAGLLSTDIAINGSAIPSIGAGRTTGTTPVVSEQHGLRPPAQQHTHAAINLSYWPSA